MWVELKPDPPIDEVIEEMIEGFKQTIYEVRDDLFLMWQWKSWMSFQLNYLESRLEEEKKK